MHEHSLADAILDAVETRRLSAGASKTTRVTIRVSELSGLTQESLQMMLDHAAEEAGAPPFAVQILCDGLLGYCPACGIVPISEDLVCGFCGAESVRPAGDEALLLVGCEFE